MLRDVERPVRVAVANDYEIVVLGIAAVLARFPDRVQLVELDTGMPVDAPVHVVLYDSFGQLQGDALDVATTVAGSGSKLVVTSWNTDPALVQASLAAGADGYVSKSVGGAELVEVIERVHAGEQVVVVHPTEPEGSPTGELERWPGQEHGLSPREAEILALICQGMTNEDITARAILSMNTVKSYVRSLYRKIGATTRVEAVLWGVDHGFRPDRGRYRIEA